MKKILFHSNQLGVRGTEVAMFDHAEANESVLGNKSYIASRIDSDLFCLKKFKDRFEVFLYKDLTELEEFCHTNDIGFVYLCRSGETDFVLGGVKNLVYSVFNVNEPHGDRYMYISKWLAEQNGVPDDYIPHIVNLPYVDGNLRQELGIPPDAIVFGRHGGETEFNIPFVHYAVYRFAVENPDTYFLFMNTSRFCPSLPNVIHLSASYDLSRKVKFINTCNAMIHARAMGESFGLAVSEFLFFDKPVISWTGGNDQNHRVMLEHTGLMYSDVDDFFRLISNMSFDYKPGTFKSIVDEFSPERVMNRFNEKYLS